jgi:hypothetical protein
MRRFGVAILRTCRFQRTEGFGILEKKSALENVDLRQIVVKGIKRERDSSKNRYCGARLLFSTRAK